jgi:uncharacterized protein
MIVVLSDSHDNESIVQKAVRQIVALSPSLVIHCGDFQSPHILDLFKDLPFQAVFGNCDGPRSLFQHRAQELKLPPLTEELEITIGSTRIYVNHGTQQSVINEMIEAQIYDYIFHGHTHIQRDERHGRTRVINPGALYRAQIYSFATLDISADRLTYVRVSH